MVRAAADRHADGVGVVAVGVDEALVRARVAHARGVALALAARGERAEAICLVVSVAAGVPVATGGGDIAFVDRADAILTRLAGGALGGLVGRLWTMDCCR